uniref:Uncharacterized protein n=1 Tax=Anguilla anguilla TaxID=7936 RepID=A0A0E9UBL9_ANGAN
MQVKLQIKEIKQDLRQTNMGHIANAF